MSAAVSDKPDTLANDDETLPFEETETNETKLHYGLGTFAWPIRILWAGLVVLAIWYVAQYYVPSLVAWMPWKP